MKKYAITLTIETILTAIVVWSMGILEKTSPVDVFHILCDGFFVVGVVATGAGALVFVSNLGAFDGLLFAMRSFVNIFKKAPNKNVETYYDYKMRHSDKQFSFAFLLICGLIFIAISLVMLWLYYRYQA